MATDAAASRGSRDKKDVTRFAPEPNKTEKGKGDMLFEVNTKKHNLLLQGSADTAPTCAQFNTRALAQLIP